MKRSDSGRRGRWRTLSRAMLGLALGAAIAYALVAWRRALLPEVQMLPPAEGEGVSLYEVTGEDASTEWTDVSLGDIPAVPPDQEQERTRRNRLIDIEGIGPVYAKTLAGLGLLTTTDLLQAGADPQGRENLAIAAGISKKLILRWVNQADLFRVKGVGEQYADLLEAAGVDTVPELAQRRADNLTRKMTEVNEQKRLVRRTPTEAQVAAWIESAKGLPRVVTY